MEHVTPTPNRPLQLAMYLLGCVVFSFGANCFIYAELGTDPLDVFALGLTKQFSAMTVGIAQGGFALLCIGIWAIWNKRRPVLSPLFTFLFCGTLIDLFIGEKIRKGRNVASYLPFDGWPLMLLGVALCAIGSALIIMSGIGIRAMDLVALTMNEKLRTPFWLAKGIFEVALLTIGWALGGPVGWGTVFFLGVVGWLIQPIMTAGSVALRLPNYGLARAHGIPSTLATA
jgi:uncharacterized protein